MAADYIPGADGAFGGGSGLVGHSLAAVFIADPVTVRLDTAGSVVVVGSRDGELRAFDCR